MCFAVAQAYKMYYSNKVTLFVDKQGILPEVDNYVVVNGSILMTYQQRPKEDVDVLVVSAVYNGIPLPQSFSMI